MCKMCIRWQYELMNFRIGLVAQLISDCLGRSDSHPDGEVYS